MLKFDASNTLKKLKNKYRLVVMNEATYQEVFMFKLNRLSLYIALSSLFMLLLGLAIALIVFTPLKYYLPGVGYGNSVQAREYRQLKIRTDSIEKAMENKQKYFSDIQKVLQGNIPKLDTTTFAVPKIDSAE